MLAKEFIENVESGNVITVRSALIDYLIIDRKFGTFDEALSYADSLLPVIEEYDGKAFEPEPAWDMRYLNLQKAALSFNFAQARINHIKEVIKAVIPAEAGDVTPAVSSAHSPVKEKAASGRTGRRVVEETVCPPIQPTPCQEPPQFDRRTNPSGKTGKRIVSETEYPTVDQQGQKSTRGFDGASALIVGGVAVAAVGLAAAEPVVIGAGVVIAGTGCVVKARR